MIFTRIAIDNLFSFKNFELDLSIKKRLKNSSIPDECLAGREKVLFRKICILTGGNASGKTSLGKVLNYIQNFISKPYYDISKLSEFSYSNENEIKIAVEFIFPNDYLFHNLEIFIYQGQIKMNYQSIFIGKNDSIIKLRKKIIEKKENDLTHQSNEEIRKKLANSAKFGWYYLFSQSHDEKHAINVKDLKKNVLEKILKTFDPSIDKVSELKKEENELNAFQIEFKNGDKAILDLEGKATNRERFSKGTYDALQLSAFVSRIISDYSSDYPDTYFLDEKMAFAHSELEQVILNLMISLLGRHSQLFYTTHNYDILDLNLPVHSYVFLRKNSEFTECIQPEKIFKKNDRRLLGYVKNDFFRTLPDVSAINELMYE